MSRERMILEHRSHTEHMLSLIDSPQAKAAIKEQRAQYAEGLPPCGRCMRWRRRAKVAAVALLVLGGVLLVGYLEKQDLEAEVAQYCQMHALWIESKGELGWPDFRGTYAQECLHEAAQ